jgi:trigger factor
VPPVVAGQDFQFRVDMEVPPEFTVADYKGMTLTDMPAEVTDAEVDARMEEIRQSNAMLKPVAETRGIAEGDFAVLSYQGYYGGEALTEAKGENTYMEVGAGKFSIDFERQLLGLTAGGESRFTVDLPQDFFNPLLAGKVIEFAVTIHEIKQKVVPDLDDAFAQSLGGNFTDLADLRKQVQEDIIRRKEGERQARLEAQLAEQLIAANPFEVPPSLVTQEQEAMLNEQMSRMQQHGLSIAGMDKEKLLEAMKPRAEQRVRVGLILERLADQEGVSVDEAEVNAALGRLAVAARQEPAKVRQFYEERQLMGGLKRQLLEEKVKKMILDQATLTPAAPSEEKA